MTIRLSKPAKIGGAWRQTGEIIDFLTTEQEAIYEPSSFVDKNDDQPTKAVGSSRDLTVGDDGITIEVTAPGVTLTIPPSLKNFGCAIIAHSSGSTLASSGGVLLNGSTSSLSLAAGSLNAVIPLASASISYKVVLGA